MEKKIEIQYKKVFSIKKRINNFYHLLAGPILFILFLIILMLLFLFVCIKTDKWLNVDATESVKQEAIHRYMLVLNKNNGLNDTLYISSNGKIIFEKNSGLAEANRYILKETGKNSIGMDIQIKTNFESLKGGTLIQLK